MATATVNAGQAAGQNGASGSENVTIVREDVVVGMETTGKDDKGQPISKPVSYGSEYVSKDEFKTDHPSFKEAYRVTTQVSKPRNYAGIKEIFGDNDAIAATLTFNGMKQKINNKLDKKLLDLDETGEFSFLAALGTENDPLTNGVLDLNEIANEKPGRVSLTEDEKMIRMLSTFPDTTALVTYNAWRSTQSLAPVDKFPRS